MTHLNFSNIPFRFVVAGLFITVLLSGCRTYGGYNSEQATYDQIQETNAVFAGEYERAVGELARLETAAGRNANLGPHVEHLAHLVDLHKEMAERHAELTSSLVVRTGFSGQLTPAYRNLNRALGNIAVDQATMHDHYERFAQVLMGEAASSGVEWSKNVERSRYQAVPPYYLQIQEELNTTSVSSALSQLR